VVKRSRDDSPDDGKPIESRRRATKRYLLNRVARKGANSRPKILAPRGELQGDAGIDKRARNYYLRGRGVIRHIITRTPIKNGET